MSAEERETCQVTYRVTGLDCPDCARTLDKSVGYLDGVASATLNFASGLLVVELAEAQDPRHAVTDLVSRMGYGIEALEDPCGGTTPARPAGWRERRHEVAVALAGALIVVGWILARMTSAPDWSVAAVLVGAVLAGGWLVFRRAALSLRTRILDMNVLMSVAVVGAIALGDYFEAASVVFLFSVGGLLESRSLARTRRSIRDLMSLAPEVAHVERDGERFDLSPSALVVGDKVTVRPGERVPVDGEVLEGSSAVDESPITGESVPVDKRVGDTVWAGSLNTDGLLAVRVTARAGDTTLARIIYLVEEAQSGQAPFQRLVDRFTRWYTPAVVGLAVAVAIVPPSLGLALGRDWGAFAEWFYRALVLLVVSCPCALVISTPVAIVSAITRATRDGVLVKGGAFLELAPRVRALAFDKTGTLTAGRPEVADVIAFDGHDAGTVLGLAAAVEAHSTHPLAAAVVRAAGGGSELAAADVREMAGRGLTATVDGRTVLVVSTVTADEQGALDAQHAGAIERLEGSGQTVLVVARDDGSGVRTIGLIGLADPVRPEARATVAALRAQGIEHLVMLTGDNERVGRAVAAQVGVDEVRARLLPEEKTAAVDELRRRHGVVAMVGDGINDAPALATADLGIAMGAASSDTALETADVALLSDDLSALPRFLALSHATVANIRQNVWFSVAIKLGVLAAAVAGYAPLWLAVFADTGVALLVVLNGLRLLRRRSRTADGVRGIASPTPAA